MHLLSLVVIECNFTGFQFRQPIAPVSDTKNNAVAAIAAEECCKSFRLFIVVKAADETEYVLYENTFDDESALDDLTVVEGAESALSIADGKLSIKGTSVRVLLPELYADFGFAKTADNDGSTVWELETAGYTKKNRFITVNGGTI